MVPRCDSRRIWRALAGATGRVGGNAAVRMAPMLDVNGGDLKAGVAGGGRRSAKTTCATLERTCPSSAGRASVAPRGSLVPSIGVRYMLIAGVVHVGLSNPDRLDPARGSTSRVRPPCSYPAPR
jgi:hypothetical protein